MKKVILCITALTSSLQLAAQSKIDYLPNPVPHTAHPFVVIAHRGDHSVYPENTLEAYQQAINDGADFIEIDLRTTKDGGLISLHDASVNRMTNGKGAINDLTLAEIQKLTVKSADSLHAAFHIPTFDEILQMSKNKINIYIDFKSADPAVVYKILKQFKMEKHVLVYINEEAQFGEWRKAAPEIPLMGSLPNGTKTVEAMLKFMNQYHFDILDGDYTQYNADMLNVAKQNKITIWPDVQSPQEDEKAWLRALHMGFKGAQTDRPALLIAFLKKNGAR